MIKRIGAVVLLDSGLVVNAYRFSKHLPIGHLRFTVERLQELRVDEIIILNSSHSNHPEMDFEKLSSDFDSWHISTPIAYGGGIMTNAQAKNIIKKGADRIVVSAKVLCNGEELARIGEVLGEQAIILHLPIAMHTSGLKVRDFEDSPLVSIIDMIPLNWGGEVLLSVVENDGAKLPDWEVLRHLLQLLSDSRRVILSSGFSLSEDILAGLKLSQVQAVAIGNYLHRTELSVMLIKESVGLAVQVR